jgi:hypothetical protein
MPSGDVLPEAIFVASLLIKPARTLHKAMQAHGRGPQPAVRMNGVTQKIKSLFNLFRVRIPDGPPFFSIA